MSAYRYPNSNVFYRKLSREFPLITHGFGCYLFDSEGHKYLDGSGGAFVANLGHGVREVAEAMGAQAAKVAYVSAASFTTEPVERLAAEIAALAPGDLDKVYFLCSGSEAVEAALKLARQYWVETGVPSKTKLLALRPGYHGNTMLALSASARQHYKTFYGAWLVDVRQVPAPYSYRCDCRGVAPYCSACDGQALEAAIQKEGPETVAAFIAEPVGGSSTGASVPPPDYYRRVRDICDRHQVLFIADEVLCGGGRTGTWFAIEQYGVVPDILTIGKGISGGYAPLSAVVAPQRIVDPIARGSGALMHAQTFSFHAVMAAAGLATVEYLRSHRLVERCAALGPEFHQKLGSLAGLPHVGDVRGRGLLAGVEFVHDKATRAPFPRKLKFAERFAEAALRAGLIVWPNVGHANGVDGDLAMLAPPFIISVDEIDEMVRLFSQALEQTVGTLETTA